MYLSNLVDVLWLLSVMVFFNIVKKVVQALLSLTIKEAKPNHQINLFLHLIRNFPDQHSYFYYF